MISVRSKGLHTLLAHRHEAADRLSALAAEVEEGLDDEAGIDLPGLRRSIDAEAERLQRLDDWLARSARTEQPSPGMLPSNAVDELAAALRNLGALVRALCTLPAGCADATRILRSAIASQMLRIMKARRELDAGLGVDHRRGKPAQAQGGTIK